MFCQDNVGQQCYLKKIGGQYIQNLLSCQKVTQLWRMCLACRRAWALSLAPQKAFRFSELFCNSVVTDGLLSWILILNPPCYTLQKHPIYAILCLYLWHMGASYLGVLRMVCAVATLGCIYWQCQTLPLQLMFCFLPHVCLREYSWKGTLQASHPIYKHEITMTC